MIYVYMDRNKIQPFQNAHTFWFLPSGSVHSSLWLNISILWVFVVSLVEIHGLSSPILIELSPFNIGSLLWWIIDVYYAIKHKDRQSECKLYIYNNISIYTYFMFYVCIAIIIGWNSHTYRVVVVYVIVFVVVISFIETVMSIEWNAIFHSKLMFVFFLGDSN